MQDILMIDGVNLSHLVSGLKVGYETLVSDNSGRNAAGNMVVDVINKKRKVYVTFRHTTLEEMQTILDAIEPYVVEVEVEGAAGFHTMECYCSTPEPEYYTMSDKTIFKPMSLNFIEL